MNPQELEAYIDARVKEELAKQNGTFQEDKGAGNTSSGKTTEQQQQESYEEARKRIRQLREQHLIR